MFCAELETRNFRFLTFAVSKSDALWQLERAWQKHAKQTDAFYTWEDLSDSVSVFWFRLGDTRRDSELMLSYDSPNQYELEKEEN